MLHTTQPEFSSCTASVPVKSPSQLPQQQKSTVQVQKHSKSPDIELQVKDPYDELLSMILDGSSSTDDGASLRLSPVGFPPAELNVEPQSRWLQPKAEENSHPEKNHAVAPASDITSSMWLEVQFHKPVIMEPILKEEQSKTVIEEPFEPQQPPSVKGELFTELFIEEEDDTRQDKEEDIKVLNERLSPQVESMV